MTTVAPVGTTCPPDYIYSAGLKDLDGVTWQVPPKCLEIATMSDQRLVFYLPRFKPENMPFLTGYQINALTNEQLISLTTPQLQALKPSQIPLIEASQLTQLTPDQFKSLLPEQIAALIDSQIYHMSQDQGNLLQPEQIASMSSEQLAALKDVKEYPEAPPAFSTRLDTPVCPYGYSIKDETINSREPILVCVKSAAAEASGAQASASISSLTANQFNALTSEEVISITTPQLQAIKPEQISLIEHSQFNQLTPEQFKSLLPEQIAALEYEQILYLSREQKNLLRPEQLASMSSEQLDLLEKRKEYDDAYRSFSKRLDSEICPYGYSLIDGVICVKADEAAAARAFLAEASGSIPTILASSAMNPSSYMSTIMQSTSQGVQIFQASAAKTANISTTAGVSTFTAISYLHISTMMQSGAQALAVQAAATQASAAQTPFQASAAQASGANTIALTSASQALNVYSIKSLNLASAAQLAEITVSRPRLLIAAAAAVEASSAVEAPMPVAALMPVAASAAMEAPMPVAASSAMEASMPVAPIVETSMPVAPIVETSMPVAPILEASMPVAPIVETSAAVEASAPIALIAPTVAVPAALAVAAAATVSQSGIYDDGIIASNNPLKPTETVGGDEISSYIIEPAWLPSTVNIDGLPQTITEIVVKDDNYVYPSLYNQSEPETTPGFPGSPNPIIRGLRKYVSSPVGYTIAFIDPTLGIQSAIVINARFGPSNYGSSYNAIYIDLDREIMTPISNDMMVYYGPPGTVFINHSLQPAEVDAAIASARASLGSRKIEATSNTLDPHKKVYDAVYGLSAIIMKFAKNCGSPNITTDNSANILSMIQRCNTIITENIIPSSICEKHTFNTEEMPSNNTEEMPSNNTEEYWQNNTEEMPSNNTEEYWQNNAQEYGENNSQLGGAILNNKAIPTFREIYTALEELEININSIVYKCNDSLGITPQEGGSKANPTATDCLELIDICKVLMNTLINNPAICPEHSGGRRRGTRNRVNRRRFGKKSKRAPRRKWATRRKASAPVKKSKKTFRYHRA